MKKKQFICLLLAFHFIANTHAFAAATPLKSQGSYVKPIKNDLISLISYTADIQWKGANPLVTSLYIVKNKDSSQKVKLLLGMPKLPYKKMQILTPTIRINGKKQSASIKKAKPANDKQDDPYITWYTWPLTIEPSETLAFECSYTISPNSFQAGVKSIKLPLKLLENWADPVGKTVVSLETSSPYSLEPAPNPAPAEIVNGTKLVWKYMDNKAFPDVILSIKDGDTAAVKYLNTQKSDTLSTIAAFYQKKRYSALLEKANAYLSKGSTQKCTDEVKYLTAQVYGLLNNRQKALDYFNQIEQKPIFGDDNSFFKEKIAYTKYRLLRELENEQTANDYLSDITSDSSIFSAWIQQNVSKKAAVAASSESKEKPKLNQSASTAERKLIKSIRILGYPIPVEIPFILGLALAVLILIYAVIGFKNHFLYRRKRYSRYKQYKYWYH